MKKFIFIIFLFMPTTLLGDYILEPANCTLKKKINCGAYLYNNKTGAVYFCELESCKEIMPALEEFSTEEIKGSNKSSKSKKSKIPKFKKKEKKKSKIPKFKKKSE